MLSYEVWEDACVTVTVKLLFVDENYRGKGSNHTKAALVHSG